MRYKIKHILIIIAFIVILYNYFSFLFGSPLHKIYYYVAAEYYLNNKYDFETSIESVSYDIKTNNYNIEATAPEYNVNFDVLFTKEKNSNKLIISDNLKYCKWTKDVKTYVERIFSEYYPGAVIYDDISVRPFINLSDEINIKSICDYFETSEKRYLSVIIDIKIGGVKMRETKIRDTCNHIFDKFENISMTVRGTNGEKIFSKKRHWWDNG